MFQIALAAHVAVRAHHVFRTAPFDQPSADFVVRFAHRFGDLCDRDAVARELVRIDGDLILANEAADAGHLSDAGHRLQLISNVPVLERAEIRERMLTRAVDERVLKHPPDTGRIRAERSLHALRKLRLYLREIFENTAACPVDVRSFVEDAVNIRVSEIGETADRFDVGCAEERGGDRIGDLVLNDVRTAIPFRENDHLRVGQIWQRVDGDVLHAPDADHCENDNDDQDEAAIDRAPANDSFDQIRKQKAESRSSVTFPSIY